MPSAATNVHATRRALFRGNSSYGCCIPIAKRKRRGGRTPNAWFARDESKPLMLFAGLHVPQWKSARKVKDGLTTDDLYGFLTTDANALVKPIHEKAMPVVLLNREETDL